jgi:transposase-like protein
VIDALKGMSEALLAVGEATPLQTCIVHLIRHSLAFGNWKERTQLAAALRPVYSAPRAEPRGPRARRLAQTPWERTFPTVVAAWGALGRW